MIALSLWKGLIETPSGRRVRLHAAPVGKPMKAIAVEVCEKHRLKLADLTGPERRWQISHPRQEAMYACWKAGRSKSEIGRFFNRDHTTVIQACRAYAAREGISTDG